ncbi:TRZ/ATZ family hydrolase [Parahaliea mediterranea]|uniref:5-methylthioadenosine/S-adenosylhomocysteine deaminase n=1 Tax=Parahaliea mediterranea TaxID=651086 RepID=A0A939DJ56_9GAMM|nr:TRZ/ATZ family hydrolase [Parahaliea mediterranea]MBN7798928.1 TRZ/ATZ family hydrolase [Parahaliea mediterranea]
MSPPAETVDTLIHPGWIIPVNPAGEVLTGYSLAIRGEHIAALLPREETRHWQADRELELPDHAVLPGLVNAHGHAAMSLLRGFADDRSLMPWLQEDIWPAEAAHVSEQFVADGAELAVAEMIRGGTTTFSDMYFFPEATARVVQSSGMRCQLAIPIIGFQTAWARDARECISKGLALRDELKHRERITVVFGPHATYTVPEPDLERVATLAAELDLPVQIHLHETAGEVLQAVEERGERPIDSLQRLGLLGPRTQCVHMTDLGEQDIALLAASGAHVIHCPQSNMKLASGSCPVDRLQAAGVNLGLGTDGAASNNGLNMFLEMHTAALLAKLRSGDATALPAASALHMATLGGARALGLDDRIGSLEAGKQADLIAVDLGGPETQPVYNPLSQLVYACNGSQVTHSWVAGRPLLAERQLTTIDTRALNARVTRWQGAIAGHRTTA